MRLPLRQLLWHGHDVQHLPNGSFVHGKQLLQRDQLSHPDCCRFGPWYLRRLPVSLLYLLWCFHQLHVVRGRLLL